MGDGRFRCIGRLMGYKIFDSDWKCWGKQYGVGEVTEQEGELVLCKNGLHYCETGLGCLSYVKGDRSNKYGEVEALGEVVGDSNKKATNKLRVLRELSYEEFMGLCTGVKQFLYLSGALSAIYIYVRGLKEGLQCTWHKNGKSRTVCNYVKGQPEGLSKKWHKNGTLRVECNYVGGLPEGLYNEWYKDGKLSVKCNYVRGQIEGLYECWYQNGKLEYKDNYVNDMKEGLCETWYENGNLKNKYNCVRGQIEGLYEFWLENGERQISWEIRGNRDLMALRELQAYKERQV